MPENLSFYCGACCGLSRIFCYNICPCRKRREVYKPAYNVLCLGLSGSGKTTLLATHCGEDSGSVVPTTGFNMKDIILDTCVMHIKEIGGAPKVRQYWQNYFADHFHGLIFVLDSCVGGEELNETMVELERVLSHRRISHLPCLILATHQDLSNAASVDFIVSTFQIEELCAGRPWEIHGCVSNDQSSVCVGFEKLASLMWQNDQGNAVSRP